MALFVRVTRSHYVSNFRNVNLKHSKKKKKSPPQDFLNFFFYLSSFSIIKKFPLYVTRTFSSRDDYRYKRGLTFEFPLLSFC